LSPLNFWPTLICAFSLELGYVIKASGSSHSSCAELVREIELNKRTTVNLARKWFIS